MPLRGFPTVNPTAAAAAVAADDVAVATATLDAGDLYRCLF